MMNGYDEKHHLDEDAFGAKGSIVSAFDAFRKSARYGTSQAINFPVNLMCLQPSPNHSTSSEPPAAVNGQSP